MTVQGADDEREVVPRWRSFDASTETGELNALRPADKHDVEGELARLRSDFARTHSTFVAGDLLSALVADRSRADETADLAASILELTEAEPSLKEFAQRVLDLQRPLKPADKTAVDSAVSSQAAVRRTRARLRLDPRNAVRRIDLALAHFTLGNRAAAARQISIAVQLAPGNRFVLRSAVRFHLSEDAPDEALALLNRTAEKERDPWLLAATIASTQLAERPVSHSRLAREMLSSENFAPRDMSELASEMATLEVHAGRMKRARLLFQQALVDPNENTVAQADWASVASGLTLPHELLAIDRGFEARSRAFARQGNWQAATDEGMAWQSDEPFALEPALNTSYAAALGLEDYETALTVAKIGLTANPDDPLLRNNAAFAAASLDDVTQARKFLDGIRGFDDESGFNTFQATQGLILFREGAIDEGRRKYQDALDGFARSDRKDLIPMATILWALEEVRIGSALAPQLTNHAKRYAEEFNHPETPLLMSRLDERLAESPFDERHFQ